MTDYICRAEKLLGYNLLDYFTDTYEETEKNEDDDLDSGDGDRDRKPGRPKNQQVQYLDQHPKRRSACRVIRSRDHNILPNFIGRYFPRCDHEDPLYCASMLVLLKPWRNIKLDLKDPMESWTDAFQRFYRCAHKTVLNLLSNIEYFHECEIAAKAKRDRASLPNASDMSADLLHVEQMIESVDLDEDIQPVQFELSPDDIDQLMSSQSSQRDTLHGQHAVELAKAANIFPSDLSTWSVRASPPRLANVDDFNQLQSWRQQMKQDVLNQNASSNESDQPNNNVVNSDPDVIMLTEDDVTSMIQTPVRPDPIAIEPEQCLEPVDTTNLDPDQYRAFDIIRRHLDQTLAGKSPPPLRMIIYGEGGTGKSQVIQTTTDYFDSRNVPRLLLKAAFTGIAASIVKGKTTHYIGQIPVHGQDSLSDETRKKLETIWRHAEYLIIDEFSMISKSFLARLSRAISIGVQGSHPNCNRSFGGISVILCGDFHQFPPVVTKARESLFYPAHPSDTGDAALGRLIYEEFQTVAILQQQHRVKDPVWKDFLYHLRRGQVTDSHMKMLKELVIDHPKCPEVDFNVSPWNDASLVTPRHGVRHQWNETAAHKWCQTSGEQLFVCDAEDTIKGRPMDDVELFTLLKSRSTTGQRRRKDLPNRIFLARGMKVMVTTNVETDLDVANGARGEIVDIILDPAEEVSGDEPIVRLKRLPICILVKLHRTRATTLKGLDETVIPIEPASIKMQIRVSSKGDSIATRTVTRRQFPVTAAYAFTDYRAQGQTIHYLIIDIAKPPYGRLNIFNVYVALSRGIGRDNIRLLRGFDEDAFRKGQVPELFIEDDRLEELNRKTLQSLEI